MVYHPSPRDTEIGSSPPHNPLEDKHEKGDCWIVHSKTKKKTSEKIIQRQYEAVKLSSDTVTNGIVFGG